jgi:hypothetical protein
MVTKIFELKLEKVTESWGKFHVHELHYVLLVTKYYSGDQITKNERNGACGTLGPGGMEKVTRFW